MLGVFNKSFRYPWRRPALSSHADDPEYGAASRYAFPKLPGVTHDPKAALVMSYSRQPTSAEFEAIDWREGRIEYGQPAGLGTALVAEFDIDNDGQSELVIKSAFVRTYESDGGRGGWDYIYVLRSLRMQDLPNPMTRDIVRTRGSSDPELITSSPGFPYRFVRPFRHEGSTFLAAFDRIESTKGASEHVDILRYLGGGKLVKVGERSAIRVERVCRLRMHPVHGAS
jgi:hypothetical protein